MQNKKQLDLLIINPGNAHQVYQGLAMSLTAIEPPTFSLLVASYVRSAGYSVDIIDVPSSGFSDDAVAQTVCDENPRLVGMFVYGHHPSASTQNMPSAKSVCDAIKNIKPQIKIMISGTHPAALPSQTLIEESVDYVCDRDGFETTVALLQHLKNGRSINDVPSLWYWERDVLLPQIRNNPPASLMTSDELNSSISSPAWDLIDFSKYRSHNWHSFGHIQSRSPYASMYTSLGCPFSCQFCCINSPFGKPSYRLWHPDNIIKQLNTLANNGVYNVKFVDEMFVLNKSHVIGICDRIIESGLKFNIWAYARVDTVEDIFLDKLKQAGFNWLGLGIESSSKFVRDGANKIYTNDDILTTVRTIQSHGIYVAGNYIFGLPDDTHESMQDTLDMSIELNCEFANFYSCMAYPGSDLYKMAIKNNWDLPSSWIGYSQHSYETFPLRTEALTSAEVLRFRDHAFKVYFSNTKYQDMISRKFSDNDVDEINSVLSFDLKRKILEPTNIS